MYGTDDKTKNKLDLLYLWWVSEGVLSGLGTYCCKEKVSVILCSVPATLFFYFNLCFFFISSTTNSMMPVIVIVPLIVIFDPGPQNHSFVFLIFFIEYYIWKLNK